jgi:inosose dehydratase
MKLGYGNYGMPATPYAEMVRQVSTIGYDGVELCVGAQWPTAPANLDGANRKQLRQSMADAGLELIALMVSGMKVLEPDDDQHAANLAELETIFALGHDLGLEHPIAINTLGGKIEEWETLRHKLAERVADWANVAASCGGVYAMEPHVGGIVNSPERALWLLRTVDHPNLKLNFDYSHFELIDVPLAAAIEALVPYAVATHVKDSHGRPPSFRFALPGEGTLDYADYMRQMKAAGYDGYITVEISAQIFRAEGYDALEAARRSYATLAAALERSQVNQE